MSEQRLENKHVVSIVRHSDCDLFQIIYLDIPQRLPPADSTSQLTLKEYPRSLSPVRKEKGIGFKLRGNYFKI